LLTMWTKKAPTEKTPWIKLSKIYEQRKDDKKTLRALEKWSKLDGKNHKLAFRLGRLHEKQNNKISAIEYYSLAAKVSPRTKKYQRALGLAHLRNKKLSKAKAPLLAVYSPKKIDEEVSAGLYQIYKSENDKKNERIQLAKLVAVKPGEKKYVYPLAKIEVKNKNSARVIKMLENPAIKSDLNAEMSFLLLKQYMKTNKLKSATALGTKISNKFPKQANKSQELAILFYKQKKMNKSKDILNNIIKTNPNPEAYYDRGRIAYSAKRYGRAADYFEKAKGHSKDVNKYLATSYSNEKNYSKALKAYEQYYQDTKATRLLTNILELQKKLKDSTGLFATLKKLVKVYPAKLEYRADLANIYLSKGDMKMAGQHLRFVLRKQPKNAKANLYLGMADAKKRSCKTATKKLAIGLKKYPEHAEGWRLIGNCYESQKKLSPALSAYKKSFKNDEKNLELALRILNLTKKLKLSSQLSDVYADIIKLDPKHPEAVAYMADVQFKKRNYKEAAEYYRQVVKKKSNDKLIWNNYGICLLENKKTRGAKKAFENAIKYGAKGTQLRVNLARIQMEDGEMNKAEKLLKEVIAKDRSNHQAYRWLSQIAIKNKQTGVAEDYLRKALRLKPGEVEYAEALANIYYNNGEYPKVISTLSPAKRSLSDASHLQYANSLLKRKRHSAAIKEFKLINRKNPSAEVVANLADLYIMRNNFKFAMSVIEKSKFKNDPKIKFILVKSKLSDGEFEEVRSMLKGLMKKDRHNADHYYVRGLSYFKQAKYRLAKKDFDKAISIRARFPEVVYYLGMCELKIGNTKKAKEFFQELKISKDAQWKAKGLLGLATAFVGEKKWTAAEHHLELAVQAYPLTEAMYRLTQVNIKNKKYTKAGTWVAKMKRIDSKDVYTIMGNVDLLLARKMKTDAMREIKKGMKSHPNDCDIKLIFIKVNYTLGYDKPVKSNAEFVASQCPEMEMSYFYLGMIAHRFFDKKEAKKQFKLYKKYGGNTSIIPNEYR